MIAFSSLEKKLLVAIMPIAHQLEMEIIRVRVGSGQAPKVQIMAERFDGTMKLDDCADLSRAISDIIETIKISDQTCGLEVSSPGIDRPLTRPDHFTRWSGCKVKLQLNRMVEGCKRLRGEIVGMEEDHVLIDLEGETQTAYIPFAWLEDARLVMGDQLVSKGCGLQNTKCSRVIAAQKNV